MATTTHASPPAITTTTITTGEPDEPLLERVRAAMRAAGPLREPQHHDRVHNAECVASFDTPLTQPGGLYVNLRTFQGFGERWVTLDAVREVAAGKAGVVVAGEPPAVLYLHRSQTRRPLAAPAAISQQDQPKDEQQPTRLAIGVEGGFAAGPAPKFEVEEKLALAVVSPPASGSSSSSSSSAILIPLPCQALPDLVSRVCKAVAEHAPAAKQEEAHSWEEERRVSRYADGLEQLSPGVYPGADKFGAGGSAVPARRLVSPNPSDWRCDETGATDNLWLNLSTGFIGSGRRNWDGSGGNGSALRHYEATGRKYPLVVKLGTITPGGADVYSYAADEDDMVEDPHLAKHLAHWGINMMQMRKTEKSMAELQVDLNVRFEFDAVTEGGGAALQRLSGPAHVGLQNLGNSCYMASVMQLLFSVPEFAARYGAGAPPADEEEKGGSGGASASNTTTNTNNALRILEAALAPQGGASEPASDLPTQLAKLGLALTAACTGAPPPLGKAVATTEGGAAPMDQDGDKDEEEDPQDAQDRNSVRPAMFKALVGRGHPEFSSARQQDAAEFWSHLLALVERAERAHAGRVFFSASGAAAASANNLPAPALFQFVSEYRTECSETHAASYRRDPPSGAFALDLPLGLATNAREVAESRERAARRKALREAEAGAYIGAGASGGGGNGDNKTAAANGNGNSGNGNGPTTTTTTNSPPVILTADDPDEAPVLPRVPLAACIAHFAAPQQVDDVRSAAAGGRLVRATRTARLATFPPYLLVHAKRFFLAPDWTPRKLEVELEVPDELDLEGALRGRGPLPGEKLQPAEVEEGGGGAAAAAGGGGGGGNGGQQQQDQAAASEQPDPEIVATVTGMGFSENAAKRAALAAQRAAKSSGAPPSAEAAMEWVLAHMDDPGVNDPLEEEGGGGAAAAAAAPAAAPTADASATVNAEAVASLAAMGFSDAQARAALLATGGSLERAADWLFSHMDGLDAAVAEVEQQQQAAAAAGGGAASGPSAPSAAASTAPPPVVVDGPGRYRLVGFVSHVGSSAACGHYVAHVRKRGRWVIFNDEKVAASEKPPRAQALLYLYRRVGVAGAEGAEEGAERVLPVAEATQVPAAAAP